jgi:hypothetical protein
MRDMILRCSTLPMTLFRQVFSRVNSDVEELLDGFLKNRYPCDARDGGYLSRVFIEKSREKKYE